MPLSKPEKSKEAPGRYEMTRTELEEKLAQKTEELERSNRELEQFASLVAHDLKSPLSTIGGFAQLLSDRYKDKLDDRAQRALSHIVKGALRMEALIRDLRTYSRVTSGGQAFKPVSSRAIIETALSNLRAPLEESGAVVTMGDMPVIYGDEAQLVQLFQNLIANAVKFRSEQQPRIHISAKEIQDAKPEGISSASAMRSELLISIRDNGIGIAPTYLEKIFEIFTRLHSEDKYPGTGAGLAICKKILELHGGRIWAESEKGQGTTVHFTIPVRQAGADKG
jgi:light-regulated signal transduction histidine kinase (bacteriophytochrome)